MFYVCCQITHTHTQLFFMLPCMLWSHLIWTWSDMIIIRATTQVIKADDFQCDRSLKSVVRLDQKHTTAIEWICHSLVHARSNITREYKIHMFNHRMADISIEWWTRRLLWWQHNEWIVKSIGSKQIFKAPIRVTDRNMFISSISIEFCVSQRRTCIDLGDIVESPAWEITKRHWIQNVRSRRNWIKHVNSLIRTQNECVSRVIIEIK